MNKSKLDFIVKQTSEFHVRYVLFKTAVLVVDLIQNVSVVEAERRREKDIGREKTTDIKHLKLHRTLTPSLRLFSVLVLLYPDLTSL